MKNIKYNSKSLSDTYSKIRTSWSEFYDSEKTILERVGISFKDSVLDLGCACGGLGRALKEKFSITDYTGIDINYPSIQNVKINDSFGTFYCGDILDDMFDNFESSFDKVISFSCVDWNIEFDDMFNRSWNFVKPGGYLIVSLRLTDHSSVVDIKKSFQEIDSKFKAQYVVLNFNEVMENIQRLNPSKIEAYGYWGNTNKVYGNKTTTLYDKVCFSVFSIKKRIDEKSPTEINLELPLLV
jgi:SAM-dependent methyltransferase